MLPTALDLVHLHLCRVNGIWDRIGRWSVVEIDAGDRYSLQVLRHELA